MNNFQLILFCTLVASGTCLGITGGKGGNAKDNDAQNKENKENKENEKNKADVKVKNDKLQKVLDKIAGDKSAVNAVLYYS